MGTVMGSTDLANEPVDHLLISIEGYEDEPLLPLNETIKSISQLFNDIQNSISVALHHCQKPADDLTAEESASIYLYTMNFSDGPNLHFLLN